MSAVAKGRAYEEAVIAILQDLNIYLTRWGSGAHDQGIDLRCNANTNLVHWELGTFGPFTVHWQSGAVPIRLWARHVWESSHRVKASQQLQHNHKIQQLLLTPAGMRMCPSLTVLPRLPAAPASWRHNISLLADGVLLPLHGPAKPHHTEDR